jgi:hypothetical protein
MHASTLKASKFAFHEKVDTWTRVADVPYTRYPAGETLSVAKPNAADELETYAAEYVGCIDHLGDFGERSRHLRRPQPLRI